MTPADRRQGIKLIATTTVFLVLSSTAVLLRAIAIRIRKTTWKNHDYLTALALGLWPGDMVGISQPFPWTNWSFR
ncbi:hypothetical protein ASPBRDRAFT_49264 [Aspergillus brasiliensis CBS 101740]|uniref:Uncharacterized protein n=1 Tax=Aspergillus brasiliensis (strain CBS 101740 / IMI 381727 / IBT 21946) TaxID=767769 RepID=A0A1L9U314_ASPBC|nr:hypothetical protein ASPBRDRAFT_49264 [Aspergillus brasiliensis CBS 101740]